jgi:hypothetical protein
MTSAGPCGMSTIIAQLACVVREMSLNALIGRAIWYGYNTPSANPYGTGTITPSADVGWPVWIGSLSSRVARVVQEVPLKGLLSRVSPNAFPDEQLQASLLNSSGSQLPMD